MKRTNMYLSDKQHERLFVRSQQEHVPDCKYHYSMVIQWHEPDKVFVVTVPELPGLGHMVERMKRLYNKGKTLSKHGYFP